MENCTTSDHNKVSVCRNAGCGESLHAIGLYHVTCFDSVGNLKWSDIAPNLVVDQGKNAMLDAYFSGTESRSFYMSLITAGTPVATSTYAVPTVIETSNAVIAARGEMSWVTASSGGVKNAAATSFTITGTATITGNLVVSGSSDVATVGDTAISDGILFSCANFAAGSKPVTAGDILNVVYSIGL